MDALTVDCDGDIPLPMDVRQRQCILPGTPVRLIELGSDVSVVPAGHDPMSDALREELESWRAFSANVWQAFSYNEGDPPLLPRGR
jgi:hypothetical protein